VSFCMYVMGGCVRACRAYVCARQQKVCNKWPKSRVLLHTSLFLVESSAKESMLSKLRMMCRVEGGSGGIMN
jgi:hypothetical protein